MFPKQVQIEIPRGTVEVWQEIVDILAEIVGIPAALIMRLTDPHIEVLVSSKSKGNPYQPGAKEIIENSGLYCERVVKTGKKLHVPDAPADDDWKDNPDVKLNMISYLGFPIKLPDGNPFGTICILDKKRNEYSALVERLMLKFRDIIEFDIEQLYVNQVLGDSNKKLTDYLNEIQTLRGIVSICANCKSIRDKNGRWHPIEKYLIKHPKAEFSHSICPTCKKILYPEYDDQQTSSKNS